MKRIKQLIGNGEILKAIEEALESINFKDHIDELLVIKGIYVKNELDKNQGIIDRKEYELSRNKTASSLMELIMRIKSLNLLSDQEPKFSKNSRNKFKIPKSKGPIFAGDRTNGDFTERVESISWSGDGDYLLTHCLNSKWFKVWYAEDRECVTKIHGEGVLRKVNFCKYDDSIWGIEEDCRIIKWKKIPSKTNTYGISWNRQTVIGIPKKYFRKPYIRDVLYQVTFGHSISTIISVQSEKEGEHAELLIWKEHSDLAEGASDLFEYLDKSWFYQPRLKQLKRYNIHGYFSGGYLAIATVNSGFNEIIIKQPDQEDITIPGCDVAVGGPNYDSIFVTANHEMVYPPLIFWDEEISKPKKIEFKAHFSPDQDFVPSTVSLSIIEVYRAFPNQIECVAVDNADGELFYFELLFAEDNKIDRIRRAKLEGHSKKITRIDLKGPSVTTCSEDGTIRIWNPKNRRKKFEIGCIKNCHPLLNPFEWNPKSKNTLAYADVHGLVHIVNYIYEPHKWDKLRASFLVGIYLFLKGLFNLILALPILVFSYFLFIENPEDGLISKLEFALFEVVPGKEAFENGNPLGTFLLIIGVVFYIKREIYNQIKTEHPYRLKRHNSDNEGI